MTNMPKPVLSNATKCLCLIFFTFLISCNRKQEKDKAIAHPKASSKPDSVLNPVQKDSIPNTAILETFADSTNIGEKGRCKIELIKHRVYEDCFVIIKFYIKGSITLNDKESWLIQNTYSYETDALMSFNPNISDYNNDDFNDISFISGTAARGANEVRRLFIYDTEKQELVSIVNSPDYPNLQYNKELDCIDAFLVYGGCSTVFLHINGDRLQEFASVELDHGLTVSTYNSKGKQKIILQDKTNEAGYIRYKNFRPLKEYDSY